jgi:hypothetical protein
MTISNLWKTKYRQGYRNDRPMYQHGSAGSENDFKVHCFDEGTHFSKISAAAAIGQWGQDSLFG